MLADLEHLIELQRLEDFVERAHATIAQHPEREKALDERAAAAKDAVAAARQRATDNQAARRVLEKDLAALQSRLSHFKDQAMEVKTNREYQAMQKEIETAQQGVREIEDRILERMLEADDLAALVKRAEADAAEVQAAVNAERQALSDEVARLQVELEQKTGARTDILAKISPDTLGVYEQVARGRKGIAMSEARNGHCSICHVRLRPQLANEVRRNDAILQCDSCQRILYFAS
jgi:hypothetical protein